MYFTFPELIKFCKEGKINCLDHNRQFILSPCPHMLALFIYEVPELQESLCEIGVYAEEELSTIMNKHDEKNKETVLHIAAKTKEVQLKDLNLLLTARCRLDARNEGGKTPLHLAIEGQHVETVKQLLTKVSPTELNIKDKNGYTPLHLAASWGHYGTTQLLLDKSCKMDEQDQDGNTPLHLAVQHYDCYSVAKLLIKRLGDKCNAIMNKKGQTPLDLASAENKKEMVKLFKDAGFDKEYNVPEAVAQDHNLLKTILENNKQHDQIVNIQTNHDKFTGLHIAAQKGNSQSTQMLLDAKADTNVKDRWGKTPLHYAVQNSKKDIVQLLLNNKCDPKVQDENGITALIYAIQNGSNEVVAAYINAKYDINQKDEHGCNPLHKAAFFGYDTIVKQLLDAGCKVVKDKRGISPVDLAKDWNFTDIVTQLGNVVGK